MYPKLRARARRLGHLRRLAGDPRAGRVLVRRRPGGERRLRVGHVPELHRVPGREAGARARVPAATYGLEMKDVFMSEDLAIGSYRHAVSQTIPEITRIAWRDKREEIEKLNPGAAEEKFVFNLSRAGIRQGLRDRLPEAGPAGAIPRRSSTSCCQRSARCGRSSSRRRPRRPRRCFSRASKTPASDSARRSTRSARTPRSAQHRFRHRQAQRARRVHAGRRDLCRAAGPADRRTDLADGPGRAAPEHQRVLRRRPEPDVEPERARSARRKISEQRSAATQRDGHRRLHHAERRRDTRCLRACASG